MRSTKRHSRTLAHRALIPLRAVEAEVAEDREPAAAEEDLRLAASHL